MKSDDSPSYKESQGSEQGIADRRRSRMVLSVLTFRYKWILVGKVAGPRRCSPRQDILGSLEAKNGRALSEDPD